MEQNPVARQNTAITVTTDRWRARPAITSSNSSSSSNNNSSNSTVTSTSSSSINRSTRRGNRALTAATTAAIWTVWTTPASGGGWDLITFTVRRPAQPLRPKLWPEVPRYHGLITIPHLIINTILTHTTTMRTTITKRTSEFMIFLLFSFL